MRCLAAAIVVMLCGCPASQNPGNETPDGGTTPEPDASTCEVKPSCSVTIKYTGTGTNVQLRGDFAADGWTQGVQMTKVAGGFEVTLPVKDQQVIVYKFVVDGTWIMDPGNTRKTPDGYGAFNSVQRVDCDQCPARAAIDWRDSIMYFVMIDRFANGSTSNDAPISGGEQPGQYQGRRYKGLREKIDAGYFNDLGVNTLWLTSPIDNADNANPAATATSTPAITATGRRTSTRRSRSTAPRPS